MEFFYIDITKYGIIYIEVMGLDLIKKYKSGERKELSTEELINFFLWAVIIVVPFMITPSDIDKYGFGKAFFMWVVSAILIICVIKNKMFKLRKIDVIGIAYIALVMIATLLASGKKLAFLGSTSWYEGGLMLAIYMLIFMVSSRYLKITKVSIEIASISGVIMAIYSILQFYNIDLFEGSANGGNAYGLIGNRNYMGTYIIMFLVFFMCIYIYYNKKRYLIYSSIAFASLLATLTRSCWVAFGVISVIGLLTVIKDKKALKRVVEILTIFIVIFIALNVSSGGKVLSRAEGLTNEIINKDERSGSGRIEIWDMTLDVVKENKLIGVGPENLWGAIIEESWDKAANWLDDKGGKVDRAHNEYLQIAANSGIPSLILYISFIVLILINIVRNIKIVPYKIIGLIIIAYLVQAFFNNSVVAVAPLFWILLGLSTNIKEVEKVSLS